MIKKKLSLKGICILVIITSVILSLLAFISGAFRKERVLSIDRPEFKNMQEVEPVSYTHLTLPTILLV